MLILEIRKNWVLFWKILKVEKKIIFGLLDALFFLLIKRKVLLETEREFDFST
jgi:hypothetical protein